MAWSSFNFATRILANSALTSSGDTTCAAPPVLPSVSAISTATWDVSAAAKVVAHQAPKQRRSRRSDAKAA
eukprot:CAMPEP_0204344120 /NCGR_PEP_ID=MMETSP0469-20131031/25398_1 /ASSEMBLY_ACC=CAM_ASM_000384 /TAXON_ID=2969 /ORGANISM="Oxyrrhis marina" /LENGTH=70 /DNA_ID=CAMNT_0051329339 /DNA_START=103 /DNA_END=312 /DNA_ORIENTATION=+